VANSRPSATTSPSNPSPHNTGDSPFRSLQEPPALEATPPSWHGLPGRGRPPAHVSPYQASRSNPRVGPHETSRSHAVMRRHQVHGSRACAERNLG
jgi:hypothetical protein